MLELVDLICEEAEMPRILKLPRCYKCGQAIRKAEYLAEPDGTARHIVCPLTPELRAWGREHGIIEPRKS
jgi:hypothetical protein